MIFYRPFERPLGLTFDLDDTLYDNEPVLRRAERDLLQFLHLQYPQSADKGTDFWQGLKHRLLAHTPALRNDMGELRRLILEQGLQTCGYRGQSLKDAVQEAFDYFYQQRSAFKVDKNISSLLEELAARVPLVAITNGNVNLAQIGIRDYFQASYHANLRQPMKPDGHMFELARQTLGLSARQILHVGDGLQNDVMGAIRAGFQAGWYAQNRPMLMNAEAASLLPHVQFNRLTSLLDLV
ncbi:HAD-IA family hydrolase [Bowmanella dokdonensis]|uniref:HAD-IA family hydrolase n=1 Tax=Bowmanella dokdonensis TaxID=751969 RepID=A0A939DN92_9ALTE|nr:HAD-IA family hydrolase [Bowmanella dokdonensis]MBN7825710.1 HAD-IA family hydrolase [Bowmanella dokdonensis]